MKKFINNLKKEDSGVMVLEATYCMALALFVMMFFLSFGFYLYQRSLVHTVATEAAEEVAQVYRYGWTSSSRDSSEITSSDIEGISKYRYLFGTDSLDEAATQRAEEIVAARIKKTTLTTTKSDVSVTVETVKDDIGRKHHEVTVSQDYSYLFGKLLSVVGAQEVDTISTTVYADEYDVLNYMNSIRTGKYLVEKTTDNDVVSYVEKSLKTIKSIISLFSDD